VASGATTTLSTVTFDSCIRIIRIHSVECTRIITVDTANRHATLLMHRFTRPITLRHDPITSAMLALKWIRCSSMRRYGAFSVRTCVL